MSEIFVDTIRKTGGSLGTDIRIKNTSVYESDGGTSVTQNTVQSLCKHWGNLDGTGTIAIRDSFNTSSATDIATGTYRFDYTNNMANINYSLQESVNETTGTEGNLNRYSAIDHVDTGFCRFGATFNSSYLDVDELYTAAFGDLA